MTVQFVIEPELLKQADKIAKKRKVNRSAFIRDLIEREAKAERFREMEAQTVRAYQAKPQADDEYLPWLEVAAWPDN